MCFWVTSLGADVQALACWLAEQDDFDVIVALDDPDAYRAEPVWSLLPLHGRLLDRRSLWTSLGFLLSSADLLVVDNHLPRVRVAPRVLVVWHGFGWRVDDLTTMKRQLRLLAGDVTRPCDRFRWTAFGDWDRRYRVERSGIAADNVLALGSAYSDLLLPGYSPFRAFDRASVRGSYSIDVARKKTILLGLTWHPGGALGHWGDETALLGRFFDHARQAGANVLVRMHDRFRFAPEWAGAVERLVSGWPNVQLKWKDRSPDSLVDLLVSDVFVSNYSSLLNACYYTGRPTIHVEPADVSTMRELRNGRVETRAVASTWKLDPSEIGGLRARSFDELLAGVDRGLAEPDCCAAASRSFVDRYITGADGSTRRRITDAIRAWL